jgi:hypothetical protein
MKRPVHSARVIYCESEAIVARLKALAEQKSMTFSEVQRLANRKLLEAA